MRAWYQKSHYLHHDGIILCRPRSVWNWRCSTLPFHSRYLFYAYLESPTIALVHFIHYKSLTFHQLRVAVLWNWLTFCQPTLNFHPSTTLHTDDIGHMKSDTSFSACNLESWEDLGTRLAISDIWEVSTRQLCLFTVEQMHAQKITLYWTENFVTAE